MSIDIERVKVAVRTAIEPAAQPSRGQISEICRLTYLDEACKEIQRMLDRRLKHPNSYDILEIFHALLLMHNCLLQASSDFVEFCIGHVQSVLSLKHYADGDTSSIKHIELLRGAATRLSQSLNDPSRLVDQRRTISAANSSAVVPPPVQSKPVPLPTPPSSPSKVDLKNITPPRIRQVLPTPDPTPPKPFSKLGTAGGIVQSVEPLTKVPASILLIRKEDVAMMTFKSGEKGLEAILSAVNALLSPRSTGTMPPDELVKALTCVHHCLYWGSAPFVTYCHEKRTKFNPLRNHSVAQVRGRADSVVNLLADSPRLHEERQSRASLMSQAVTTSSPQKIATHNEASGGILVSVLEPVLDVSRNVIKSGIGPVAGGGYSDVWKGEYWRGPSGKEVVAIKFLRRLSKIPPDRLQKHLNRELHVWRTLLHKNISPFYGVVLEATGEVGMVSPFYSNGNVLKYVKLNQHINPVEMLRGIADGIAYLHVKRIVHGDIKCANVMVTDEGIPRLIDFGLTQVIDEYAEATGYTTSNLASSLRWSAPELLVGDSPISSKSEKSDVYAFASTCIEIMTLECPYVGLRDPQVLQRVLMDNKIPARPPMEAKWSPSDELWDFLTTCWRKDREDRPNIVAVQRKLAEFYHGVAPGSSTIRQLR